MLSARQSGRLAGGLGALALLAGTFAASGGAAASPTDQAAHLRQLNPAARLGGRTIVGTGDGQRLKGRSGTNFIVALGANETIVGGTGNDQLGSLGPNATIIAGRGSDTIYGGPHATVDGGPGRDLLIDTYNGATVHVNGSHNKVVVSGRDDKVSCAPGSHNDLIYANATDRVDAACRTNHAQVHATSASPGPMPEPRLLAAAAAQPVQGDGTNGNPYMRPCNDPMQQNCTVSFPPRSLTGFWANEFVPSYRCPNDHPYLLTAIYGQFVTLPVGVEVRFKPPSDMVGIAVTIIGTRNTGVPDHYVDGILTGFPNSSATNWTTGTSSYQVVLHCTSDSAAGYK